MNRGLQQLNPQLSPGGRLPVRRRLRAGAGGYTDFASLVASEPAAAASWGTVQAQLGQENAGTDVIGVAQNHFYSSWEQLTTGTVLSGNDLVNAGTAAASLTLQNNSLGGAASLVEGLIQGASSGNVTAVVQGFSGSLCSIAASAIAAGTLSFGAGAAIIVGVELASSVLGQLFAGPPTVASVCGVNYSFQPSIIVGCVTSTGQPLQPGGGALALSPAPNPFWRRFPEPSNGGDSWWFQPCGTPPGCQTQWSSNASTDRWFSPATQNAQPQRPIDFAFPQYHQLECDAVVAGPIAALPDGGGSLSFTILGNTATTNYSSDDVMFARFIMAYFGAWKANAEFALNGISPQYADDVAVLVHLFQFWQNTHQAGATRTVTPHNNNVTSYLDDVARYPGSCVSSMQTEWWYVSMLLNKAATRSMVVNTGPKVTTFGTPGHTFVPLKPIGGIGVVGGLGAKNSSSSSSTLTDVAMVSVGVIAGTLLGTAIYARVKHKPYKAVWRGIEKKTIGKLHVPHLHLPHLRMPKLGAKR